MNPIGVNRNLRQYTAMRVLMVSAAYPPDHCGVGDYARHLVDRLARRRSVDIAVLTASRVSNREYSVPAIVQAAGRGVRSSDLWRAARHFKPDLVHLQSPTQRALSPLAALCARRLLGLPVVRTAHEYIEHVDWQDRLSLPALNGLLYVREDFPDRLAFEAQPLLRRVPMEFVANGRTIPAALMSDGERAALRAEIGGSRAVVAFFGFANPNKGVELLFEIADPERHHLLLVCDLDPAIPYQRRIGELVRGEQWRGRVSVTGHSTALQVARWLAAADAVVFPFPGGVGPWNSSVNAALASGSLVVATSRDRQKTGYDAGRNMFLAAAGDVAALRAGLQQYLGARRAPDTSDDWDAIAQAHERFYERFR